MAVGGRNGPERAAADEPAVTEPITLTDPDGAVTRVAPWSSWTREQTRAPGGEPALVTRLERGQLWFSAGRKRSPWRHEVQVGPATVSTPRGRFQVTAEPDGGATIACLAGRTRVVTGLREPVLLGPDQSAAVSSDGRTLVVMDRNSLADAHLFGADAGGAPTDPLAPGAAAPGIAGEHDLEDAHGEERSGATHDALAGGGAGGGDGAGAGGGDGGPGGSDPGPGEGAPSPWYRRLAEAAAVLALAAVLIAAIVVFGHGSDEGDAAAPATTSTTEETPSSSSSSSTSSSSTSTSTSTSSSSSTTTSTTTAPRPVQRPGSAVGSLGACRRAEGGVEAQVTITHRSGGPGRFRAEVGLTDDGGKVQAKGSATSGVIAVGGSEQVTVLVPVQGKITGSCELIGVTTA